MAAAASEVVSDTSPAASTTGRVDLVERFLDAASELLTHNPPSAITGRQLADAAGLNYGLLHRHLGSKKAALHLALDRIGASFVEDVFDPDTDLPRPNPLLTHRTFWRATTYVILDEASFRDFHPRSPVLVRYRRGLRRARPELTARDVDVLVILSIALQLGTSALYRQAMAPVLDLDPSDPRIDELIVQWVSGAHNGTGPLGSVPERPRALRSRPWVASTGFGRRRDAEQLLVEAGARLLADRAPSAISGRQLAGAAGVNYGLIHHYFRSKDEVLRQSLMWHRRQFFDATVRDGRGPDYFELRHFPGFVRALTWDAIDRGEDNRSSAPPTPDEARPAIEFLLGRLAARHGSLTKDQRIALLASVSTQLAWVLMQDPVELELGGPLEPLLPFAAAVLHRLVTGASSDGVE